MKFVVQIDESGPSIRVLTHIHHEFTFEYYFEIDCFINQSTDLKLIPCGEVELTAMVSFRYCVFSRWLIESYEYSLRANFHHRRLKKHFFYLNSILRCISSKYKHSHDSYDEACVPLSTPVLPARIQSDALVIIDVHNTVAIKLAASMIYIWSLIFKLMSFMFGVILAIPGRFSDSFTVLGHSLEMIRIFVWLCFWTLGNGLRFQFFGNPWALSEIFPGLSALFPIYCESWAHILNSEIPQSIFETMETFIDIYFLQERKGKMRKTSRWFCWKGKQLSTPTAAKDVVTLFCRLWFFFLSSHTGWNNHIM